MDFRLTQTHSLRDFSTGGAARRTLLENRGKLKCLASGQVSGDGFLLDKTPETRQQHCPLRIPSTHRRPQSSNTISETPSAWVAWVVPPRLLRKRTTPRHIIINLPKVSDKERILKAAREKQIVTYKGIPIDCQLISQKKLCRLKGTGKK